GGELAQGRAELTDGVGSELAYRPAQPVAVAVLDLDVQQRGLLTGARGWDGMVPVCRSHYPRLVPEVLIASDAPWLRNEVRACVDPDVTVREVATGRDVRAAVAERAPDLAVIDLQIGSMG